MGAIASQITSLTILYSTLYSDGDQRKHQSSASLAFVRGLHRGPVNSPHKWPVTRKMFPFDDVIMKLISWALSLKSVLSERHKIPLMISQHWFRQWLGAVRHQAITCANVDTDLRRHMVSLSPNEFHKRSAEPLPAILWYCLVNEL